MNKIIQSHYRKFRSNGESSKRALRCARILEQWEEAEQSDLVRLRAIPEEDSYFDVFGKPDSEKERLQIEAALERMGCFYIVSEVNKGDESTGPDWEIADSIGMCVYENPLSPFENCYVPDLMEKALESIPQDGQH